MDNQTKYKKKYIEEWNRYIGGCYALCWTPSRELSDEIRATIDKLKDFVPMVAKDKKLKGD
jgi:hypothetical protein